MQTIIYSFQSRVLSSMNNDFKPLFNSASQKLQHVLKIALVIFLFPFALFAQTRSCTISSNPTSCKGVSDVGFWMKTVPGYTGSVGSSGLNFSLSGSITEDYSSGTATISGTITSGNLSYQLTIGLSGRTTSGISGYSSDCSGYSPSTADWYYYTSASGSLISNGYLGATDVSLGQMGGSFQVGTGANLWDAGAYGGAAWFTLNGSSQADFGGVFSCQNPCTATVNASNTGLYCAGNTISLSATPSGASGTITYEWTGPAGFTSSLQNPTSNSGAGVYTVTMYYNGGCSASSSTTVTVNPLPTVSVNSVTICSGTSGTLTATGCNGTVSWNTGSSGTTLTASPSITTTYTATCTSPAGCKASGSGTITVVPKPAPTVNSPSICRGESAVLTVSNCAGDVTWSDGGTGNPRTVSPTSTRTYTATCSVGTCTGTAIATVTVNAPPVVGLPDQTICAGQTITFGFQGQTGLTYVWSTGATTPAITVSPTITTNYIVTVTATASSCSTKDTAQVVVTPRPNAGSDVVSCQSTIKLNAAGTGETWSFLSFNDPNNPTLTATASITQQGNVSGMTLSGFYRFLLTNSSNCSDTIRVQRRILTLPNITLNPVCEGTTLTFGYTNTTNFTYLWSTGETTAKISVTPTQTTDYIVTATEIATGCTVKDTTTATIKPKPTITVVSKTCAADLKSYTVNVTVPSGTVVTSNAGIVSGSGTAFSVKVGADTTSFTILADLNGCKASLAVTKPNCSCPTINPPVGTSETICSGDVIPALTVTVDAGLQADWYSSATSTTKLASGLSYTPTAAQYPLGGDFYVEAINTTSGCKSVTRTKVSLIVNPKPNAGLDMTLACITTLNTSTTLTASPAGGTWALGNVKPMGTTPVIDANTGAVTNMTVPGVYNFIYNLNGCKDTVAVTVSPCEGCNIYAGVDQTLTCSAAGVAPSTTTLIPVTFGGIWIAQAGNPTMATITGYNVTGMTATGTYKFIYSRTEGGLTCTDTVQVIVPICTQPKGSIGDYVWKDANNDGIQQTTELPVKDVIVQLLQGTTVLATDTTDTNGLYLFPNLSSGTYQVKILTASFPAGCTLSTMQNQGTDDTKDSDFNPTSGLSQTVTIDATGTGIAKDNITVDGALYSPCVKPNAGKDSVLACTNVGIPAVISLVPSPTGGTYTQIGTTPAIATIAGTTVTNMPVSGTYQFVYTTAAGCKDTVAVTVPPTCLGCLKPNAGPDITLTCPLSGIVLTTATLTPVTSGGTWAAQTGNPATTTVTGNNVSGLTLAGTYKFIYTVTSGGQICTDTVQIIIPNCGCVSTPPLVIGGNPQVCIGDTFPTLKVSIVGTGTVDWYAVPTGGTALASNTLSYKPSGIVTTTVSYYAQAKSTDPTCPAVSQRTMITVNIQDCSADYVDLHLTKKVDKKIVQIGDVITYTIKVWNEFIRNATGIEVTDNLPAGVQYVSSVASRGNYNNTTGIWTIGNMAANGDTVTLSIQAKVMAEGVTFNTAEISRTDEKDKDSTPGNGVEGEDDLDRVCITTPIKLCAGQGAEVTIPSTYTGIVWKDAQGNVVPSSGNTVTFTKAGTYTFTATNGSCPTGGCCPVIIEEINCCPAQICIPLTIVKKRK